MSTLKEQKDLPQQAVAWESWMERQKRLRREQVPNLLKAKNRAWLTLLISTYCLFMTLGLDDGLIPDVVSGISRVITIIFFLFEVPASYLHIERAAQGEPALSRWDILEMIRQHIEARNRS